MVQGKTRNHFTFTRGLYDAFSSLLIGILLSTRIWLTVAFIILLDSPADGDVHEYFLYLNLF
jgi:hypothetical protein